MSRITFEIPQSKHPFVGLGKGIIITENGKEEPKIIIRFPLHGIEIITAKGDEAKSVMLEMNSDECYNRDRIEYAKDTACEILGITSFDLNIKKKNEKAVFARWLVWQYAKNSLNFSFSECGDIFEKDHSTVMNAIKKLKPDNIKFLSMWQQVAHKTFWKEMDKYTQMQA